MPIPNAGQILERIYEIEQIRDEAESAGDMESRDLAVTTLGLLWAGFYRRMGQPARPVEEFERLYRHMH